ncbi:MAG: pyrroline-5-carboxylate reductase [bacterium]
MSYEKAGIIGVGNMGEALLKGMLEGDWTSGDILFFEVKDEVANEVESKYGVEGVESVGELRKRTDFLILCVKPDVVDKALGDVSDQVVNLISIAAGVTLETLLNNVGEDSRVIRVMPNTPAQIGRGMSFLCPDSAVDRDFLHTAENVLGSIGKAEVVQDEDLMDSATALSGSGPGYVFYFLEILTEAGEDMGFDPETASKAALQTLIGSALLAEESDQSPAELREAVTSPGGTTEAALEHLKDKGYRDVLKQALETARKKSIELGE